MVTFAAKHLVAVADFILLDQLSPSVHVQHCFSRISNSSALLQLISGFLLAVCFLSVFPSSLFLSPIFVFVFAFPFYLLPPLYVFLSPFASLYPYSAIFIVLSPLCLFILSPHSSISHSSLFPFSFLHSTPLFLSFSPLPFFHSSIPFSSLLRVHFSLLLSFSSLHFYHSHSHYT